MDLEILLWHRNESRFSFHLRKKGVFFVAHSEELQSPILQLQREDTTTVTYVRSHRSLRQRRNQYLILEHSRQIHGKTTLLPHQMKEVG